MTTTLEVKSEDPRWTAMSAIPSLPDYCLDPPEDEPECPNCDGPLRVWEGYRAECHGCGWTRDEPEEREDTQP